MIFLSSSTFTGRIRIKGIAKNSWYAGTVCIVQRRKLFIQEARGLFVHSFSDFVRRRIFFEKKKSFSDRFIYLSFIYLPRTTKIYNVKITRSRRERRYFLRLYHSIIHPFLAFNNKKNIT